MVENNGLKQKIPCLLPTAQLRYKTMYVTACTCKILMQYANFPVWSIPRLITLSPSNHYHPPTPRSYYPPPYYSLILPRLLGLNVISLEHPSPHAYYGMIMKPHTKSIQSRILSRTSHTMLRNVTKSFLHQNLTMLFFFCFRGQREEKTTSCKFLKFTDIMPSQIHP